MKDIDMQNVYMDNTNTNGSVDLLRLKFLYEDFDSQVSDLTVYDIDQLQELMFGLEAFEFELRDAQMKAAEDSDIRGITNILWGIIRLKDRVDIEIVTFSDRDDEDDSDEDGQEEDYGEDEPSDEYDEEGEDDDDDDDDD